MGIESAGESTQKRDSSDTDSDTDTSQPESEQGFQKRQSEDVNRQVEATRTDTTVSGTGIHRAAKGDAETSTTAGHTYTNYDSGPDHQELSARYGLDFCKRGQAGKVQRLESEFGAERVARWADEGMTVETMGKPQDMQAFRQRQEGRSEEVPADVERQNQASLQRNRDADQDDGPAGDVGAPDAVRRVISSPGRSLDETVQREMESKMGGDFSDVQLHTGPDAAAAAESINARAFTVGNHVAFNRGEYNPESNAGKKVLAHELTHVRQQTRGTVSMLPKGDVKYPGGGIHVGGGVHVQPKLEVSSPDDPAEKEAERVADEVMKMDDAASLPAEVPTDGIGRKVERATQETIHRQETSDGPMSPVATEQGTSDGPMSLDLTEQEAAFLGIATSDQERDTFMSLIEYIRDNGWNMNVFTELSDFFADVLGVIGDDLTKLILVSDEIYNGFFDMLGNVGNVISAATAGWDIGTHLRNGEVSQAFAVAYREIMSFAVPIGGLIDAVVNLIYFIFGDVPYIGRVAEVLKALNPIELGGVAVDTFISLIHAIGAAFGFGNQTAYQVLLQLEGRIEDAAGPVVRFFEATRIQAALAAGIDTIMTLLDIAIEQELSMEQINQLVQRYEEYGLTTVVAAGEWLGDRAFETRQDVEEAFSEAGRNQGTSYDPVGFWRDVGSSLFN